jgi:hypothetical protein
VLLGATVIALGAAACGESPTDVARNDGAQMAQSPDENVILRGDVGDFVWCDVNDNGAQDDGPTSGVNGVDVVIECIRDVDGSLWTMTFTTTNSPVTALSGWYNFNAVPAGSCLAYVDPASIPAGKVLSDKACGGPLEFYIGAGTSGNNNKNVDFCLVEDAPPPGAIGDFVWCDLNNDGVQDPGEPGVAGVVVDLSCADGSSNSTVTDSNGFYLFENITPGVLCTVSLDLSSLPSDKTPGDNCPTSSSVTVGPGETDLDQDFCLVEIPPDGEGCTPGYWKTHPNAWAPTGYMQVQSVQSVFSNASLYGGIGGATLREALAFSGGSGTAGAARILLRAAVASLLNASHPDVNFPWSAGDVIMDVNAALGSLDRATMLALASTLDQDNNLGCPLN